MISKDELTVKSSTGNSEVAESKIVALIQLLGDEDVRVRKVACQQLLMIGKEAVPFLEQVATADSDGRIRIEARGLLHKIVRDDLLHTFHLLSVWDDQQIELEQGAYLLAKFAYPNLEKREISEELDRLAGRVRELLADGDRPRRVIQLMNNVLFTEARFEGNRNNYYAPDNSFINKVLQNRKGIPISLSLVYILVGQRLGLPVFGVNMPAHFLCKFEAEDEHFYIDAFDFGRVMNESECIMLLKNYGVDFNFHYLKKASNRDILSRMLRNLILVYYQNEEDEKADFLKKLLKILKHYSRKTEY